jgi:hypothetical protein
VHDMPPEQSGIFWCGKRWKARQLPISRWLSSSGLQRPK